ncbi:MAG: TetR/AcrR family transcriptional regulator [Gloeocapsa sp. UFS-A4-WI-NPMV-4B04]|jgi:AcrR family transcriptional regulator|nr:TetR/AcrR family transcriptional regulator [Gloeocapsa sp. UFS-A4-WI-NPMV-4B04]
MPKIVDHHQYRKELLMKSFDLFAQKGYSSITMRQLAQELGVSTGTLYHYFPSKEALFLQLSEELEQQNILHFLTEAGNLPTLSERIEHLFNFIAKNEDFIGKQTLLWIDFCQQQDWADVSTREKLKEIDDQTIQAIADYLEISDRKLVDFIFNLIYGLLLRRLFGEETVSYAEQGALLSKMLTADMKQ